jgi:tetratricopeptide (TPR) repeat protein
MSFVAKWYGFGQNEHYDSGVRAYESGSYEEALDAFRQCLAGNPDRPIKRLAEEKLAGVQVNRAERLAQEGHHGREVEAIREAVALRPHYADLKLRLGRALYALGDLEGSRQAADEALELNSRYGRAMLLKALLDYRAGDRDRSLKQLHEAAAMDLRLEPEAFGEVLEKHEAGDFKGALAALELIRVDRSRDANVISSQADEFARSRRWNEANELYREALEIAPRYADVHCKLGQTLLELDEVEQAAIHFEEALTINPHYAEALALLGVSQKRLGDLATARRSFRRALEVDPNQPIAAAEIAR